MSQLRSFLFEVLQTVALALGIFAIVYLFLLQPHQVRGHSMDPNFYDGEYLLTDKLSYRIGEPKRGDVVVFAAPPTRNEDFIKRIVGVPGDTIAIRAGKVWLNEKELKENYLPETTMTFAGPFLSEEKILTLAKDEYFMLGDNRGHSSDSRFWGPIKKEDIVGRAWIVYWPPSKIGIIPRVSFANF